VVTTTYFVKFQSPTDVSWPKIIQPEQISNFLIFGMGVYNDKLQMKFTFCSGPMAELWPLDFEIWPNI
jgi:hypothetical protein